jgi:hypothetical protein
MTEFLPSTPNEAYLLQINNSLLAENTARTQNDQLSSAWEQSKVDKKQMQTTIHNLNEQPTVMKLEIEKLKLNQKIGQIISQEEENDDSDLADDMKWVRVQNFGEEMKLADAKSLKQSTENKDKASTTASLYKQNSQINHRPLG